MIGQTDSQKHELIVSGRRTLKITGVKEVDSFDECGAVIKTDMGELTVEGEELKMGTLDTERGIISFTGKINGMFYSNDVCTTEKKGLLSKLFK